MLNDNKYYYEDKHLYFWFGGHHSSEYNLFITSKNDLKIENATGASTQYNNAMFQEGVYLLGTSRKQKTFKRKVAAEGLTLDKYKEMMLWLREGATGFLCFDSNPWWGWTVVLESTTDATASYAQDSIIVEFELTWKTIGSYLATNRYESMGIDVIPDANTGYVITNNNPYGLPAFFCSSINNATRSYQIINIGNVHQQIDYIGTLNTETGSRFNVAVEQYGDVVQYLDLQFAQFSQGDSIALEYYGSSGFTFADGRLAEEHQDFISSSQPNGLLVLSGPAPLEVKSVLTQLDWENLQNIGYQCMIGVQVVDPQVRWGVDPYASENIAGNELKSSIVHVYNEPQNVELQSNHKYYAVSTQTVNITGIKHTNNVITLDDVTSGRLGDYNIDSASASCLNIHNYNNL